MNLNNRREHADALDFSRTCHRAIEHRAPDRVPIDINPVPDFYRKLKDRLGLQIDEPIDPGFMEEAIPHPAVLKALGADLISTGHVEHTRHLA